MTGEGGVAPVLISVLAFDSAPRLAQAGGLGWPLEGVGGGHPPSPLPEAAQKAWMTLRVEEASLRTLEDSLHPEDHPEALEPLLQESPPTGPLGF